MLYDVMGLHEGDGTDLDFWVRDPSAVVVAISRDLRPDLDASALRRGADALISLGVTADQLAAVIKAAVDGDLHANDQVRQSTAASRPGQAAGLTFREAETIAMIVRGLSNDEIAVVNNLSINSVKSYIRSAYRKIGVVSRTQAVTWAVQHGFAMDPPSTPRT